MADKKSMQARGQAKVRDAVRRRMGKASDKSSRRPVVDLVGTDPELLAAIIEVECHADRDEIEAAA